MSVSVERKATNFCRRLQRPTSDAPAVWRCQRHELLEPTDEGCTCKVPGDGWILKKIDKRNNEKQDGKKRKIAQSKQTHVRAVLNVWASGGAQLKQSKYSVREDPTLYKNTAPSSLGVDGTFTTI